MQRNWKGRNVDLALLATRIWEFFEEKDSVMIKREIPAGYQIMAENSPFFQING